MISREYRGALIVVFMLLALVGCGKDTKSSESKNTVISKENSLTSSESKITDSKLPAIPSPPAELRSKDKVTVYALSDGGEIYEATEPITVRRLLLRLRILFKTWVDIPIKPRMAGVITFRIQSLKPLLMTRLYAMRWL